MHDMATHQAVERVLTVPHVVDLRLTLGPLRRGRYDPCIRMGGEGALWARRTPEGPATIHIRVDGSTGAIAVRAWGPGSQWAVEALPDLIGAGDDDSPLTSLLEHSAADGSRLLKDLHRRMPGLRIPRTGAVTETLIPIILEQKVAGIEAHRSYRQMVTALGERAPGPPELVAGLMLPPPPAVLFSTPYWAFHQFGVERKRAETIRLVCSYAARLDELAEMPLPQARQRLVSLPGIGQWSAAEVSTTALGDTDAVSLGDFHLPHVVAWALTHTRRSDDETMLRLLEPYSGQRARVIRLIEAAGIGPPRRGPRQAVRSFRTF